MHSVDELYFKLETLVWEQNEGDGVLLLSSFFKLLPLVLKADAGEEEADCKAGAFVCGLSLRLLFSWFEILSPSVLR